MSSPLAPLWNVLVDPVGMWFIEAVPKCSSEEKANDGKQHNNITETRSVSVFQCVRQFQF